MNLKPEARTLTLTLEEHVRVLGFNPVLGFGSGPWTQSKVGVQRFLLTHPRPCGFDIIMQGIGLPPTIVVLFGLLTQHQIWVEFVGPLLGEIFVKALLFSL